MDTTYIMRKDTPVLEISNYECREKKNMPSYIDQTIYEGMFFIMGFSPLSAQSVRNKKPPAMRGEQSNCL